MSLEDTSTFQQQKQFAESMLRARANQAAFATSGSLQKLAQRCILTNRKFFCDLEFYEKKNPFMRISNAMKKELMELDAEMQEESTENCKDAELQLKMLQLLLNQKITSFQFPPCLRLNNFAATTRLGQMLLAVAPPDLHTIIVCTESTCPSWDNNWGVRPFFERLLPAAFPYLQVLRLGENFECDDQDLEKIAEHLPTLRILEVDVLDNVSKEGICALQKLTSLEEFLFCKSSYLPVGVLEQDFIRPCLQLLPHLHALAVKPTRQNFFRPLSIRVGNALARINELCVLQLRHLSLDNFNRFSENISMPELQVLFLTDSLLTMYQPLPPARFPKLSELHLFRIDEDDLLLILVQIGQQLQALSFTFADRHLWLDRVLDVCPNLSELDVKGYFSPHCVAELKPDTLQRLQTPTVNLTNPVYLQSGLLLQILRLAPELRSVDLGMAMLDDEDLKQLAELAEQQICMAKLEHVHMVVDYKRLSDQSRRLLDEAIVSCSINCPKLQNFSLSTK